MSDSITYGFGTADFSKPSVQADKTVRELQIYIHEWAKRLGWWDLEVEKDRPVSSQIALMHSELSEALECIRDGMRPDLAGAVNGKPEGFGIELADCVIRILDTCERYGIDLQGCIERKMAYNETREYRHGGKKF